MMITIAALTTTCVCKWTRKAGDTVWTLKTIHPGCMIHRHLEAASDNPGI